MRKKRGMVLSLMIIIGISVLIIFFLAFAMRNEISELIKPKVSDVNPVQVYVENCVDAVSKYGLYKMGKQGGSISLDDEHFSHAFLNVNYAFNSRKTLPEISAMEEELENFVSENIKNCTRDFKSLESRGMKIKEGNATAEVIPTRNSVIVKLHYPLSVDYQGKTFLFETFQKSIPVKLKKVRSDTDAFLGKEKYDMLLLNEMDSNVYIMPFGKTDLFVEERLGSRVNSEDYLFIFAAK